MLSGRGTAVTSLAVQQPNSCLTYPLPRKDKDLWSHLTGWTEKWCNWFQPCYSPSARLVSHMEAEGCYCDSAAGWLTPCFGHTDHRVNPQLCLVSYVPEWHLVRMRGPQVRCKLVPSGTWGTRCAFCCEMWHHDILYLEKKMLDKMGKKKITALCCFLLHLSYSFVHPHYRLFLHTSAQFLIWLRLLTWEIWEDTENCDCFLRWHWPSLRLVWS